MGCRPRVPRYEVEFPSWVPTVMTPGVPPPIPRWGTQPPPPRGSPVHVIGLPDSDASGDVVHHDNPAKNDEIERTHHIMCNFERW